MIPPTRILFFVLGAFIPPTVAQAIPANLTASIVTYSTNQCCGGSIGYNRIRPGQCVQTAGHPSIYGASITVTGLWSDTQNVAYGYLTGWADNSCRDKVYEIRYEGCTSVSPELRARSWSWTEEVYVPPYWRRNLTSFDSEGSQNDSREVVGPAEGMANREEGWKTADWFRSISV